MWKKETMGLVIITTLVLNMLLVTTIEKAEADESWVPYIPSESIVTIEMHSENQHTYMDVCIQFGVPCYNVTWGVVNNTGDTFYVNTQITRWTGFCILLYPDPFCHTYDLGILNDGNYTFVFSVWDTLIKTVSFSLASETSIVDFQGIEPLYTTEYIEIAITIGPKEAIAGVQFDMYFESSMLSVDWVAEGELFNEYDSYFNPGVIDNINGTLKNVVSLITTPNGNTTDQGSIAIVAIRAKTISGETPLTLSNVIVGKPDATPLEVKIINTTVTIYHHDRWDINWDDQVNILDLIIIGQWWGETGTPCWASADVNCDGVINILDMILVGQHWTE